MIETSGFTDRTAIAGTRHSEKLKVVERLTRVSGDIVNYDATVSDSETWTAHFTVVVPRDATQVRGIPVRMPRG